MNICDVGVKNIFLSLSLIHTPSIANNYDFSIDISMNLNTAYL